MPPSAKEESDGLATGLPNGPRQRPFRTADEA